jgi:hypothetical protein
MNLEELDLEMHEINTHLEELGGDDRELTNKQWREKVSLRQQKDCLEKVKKAKERGNISQEATQMANYIILKEAKNRHPLLTYLMQLKCRSHIFG